MQVGEEERDLRVISKRIQIRQGNMLK